MALKKKGFKWQKRKKIPQANNGKWETQKLL